VIFTLGCALDTFLDLVRLAHARDSIDARSSRGLWESSIVSLPRRWHRCRLGDSIRRCPVSLSSESEKRDSASTDVEESGMFYGNSRNADYA